MARRVTDEPNGFSIAYVRPTNEFGSKLISFFQQLKSKLSDLVCSSNCITSTSSRYNSRPIPIEAELCLLLCCMFPQDFEIPIEDLIIYGMGIKLFEDVYDMIEARHRVHGLIQIINDRLPPYYLIKLYLWEDKYMNQYVKVLDCAHDLTKSIASKYQLVFGCETIIQKWANTNMYQSCYGLSLVLKRIKEHPINLEFPKLAMLKLQYKDDSQSLPVDFFGGMKELRVLSLNVPSVSQSLSMLKNLQTLHLKVCNLEDMSWIGGLTSLEFLSVSTISLVDLPREMRQLGNMRFLDLKKMNLAYIPPDVLTRMVKLKELYLPLSFKLWGSRGKYEHGNFDDEERFNSSISEIDGGERFNASLSEIGYLELNALQISIPNVLSFPKQSPVFKNIQRFKIIVPNNLIHFGQSSANELQLRGDACDIKDSGICCLMNKTEDLSLIKVGNLKNVMYQLEDIDFSQLKKMIISECDELEYVVDITNTQILSEEEYVFWKLESLHLSFLFNLKAIWHGKWTTYRWFVNLVKISIRFCHKLKYVFPVSIVRGCGVLKSIEILDCNEIEGIFYLDEEGDISLLRYFIEELDLHSLPKLVSFFVDEEYTSDNVGQFFTTNESLFTTKESTSTLNKSCIDDEELICPPPISTSRRELQQNDVQQLVYKNQVSHIKNKHVNGPTKIYYAFSSNLAEKWLQNLKRLKIAFCNALKVVFLFKDNHVTSRAFNSLKELELYGLRNLTDIWLFDVPSKITAFQNLQLLILSECHNSYLFSLRVAKLLVQLQKIFISSCERMEEIILKVDEKDVEDQVTLPQLKLLELQHIPNLMIFSNGFYAIELPSLESLKIVQCNKMKSFSYGSLRTPKLKSVQINGSLCSINGDLNASVKRYMGNHFGDPSNDANPSSTISTKGPPSTGPSNDSYDSISNDVIYLQSSTESFSEASSCSSDCFHCQFFSAENDEANPDGEILKRPNYMKEFTFVDLKIATKNFSSYTLLGKGGFGEVYKGWLDEKTFAPSKIGTGMAVAIKKLNPESKQGFHHWQSEVEFLKILSHPNLVKLLGHCWEDKELLLVYEFMPKGSLDNHLFRRNPMIEPLSWDMRLKIAIGAARGLDFLYTSKKVIHRDFNTSNILLDGNYNAKISDFGFAISEPSDWDPSNVSHHYVKPGDLHAKGDVYSFGMVLLELVTGLKMVTANRLKQENLVGFMRKILLQEEKLKMFVDKRMEGQYSWKAMLLTVELASNCTEFYHNRRPSMTRVVDALEAIKGKSN